MVEVIYDTPSGLVMTILKIPCGEFKSGYARSRMYNSELSISQKNDALLNAHEIVAVSKDQETEESESRIQ